jgi:hypothetical protein
MDVTGIARLATSLTETRQSQEMGAAVLRKALDLSAANAAALLASVSPPGGRNLPAHLGKNIDTSA